MVPDPPAGGDTGSTPEGGTLIFVSDASAEAERLTTALRERGYPVVDVPLGLLVSRVSVQRPSLILCDADAAGALDAIQRLHDSNTSIHIPVLFLCQPGRSANEQGELFGKINQGVFERPVDDAMLLQKIESLIGAPSSSPVFTPRPPTQSRAPVLVAATRRPYRYDAAGNHPEREEAPASRPAASRPAAPLIPPAGEGFFGLSRGDLLAEHPIRAATLEQLQPGSPGYRDSTFPSATKAQELPQAKLSAELESLLASAERRVQAGRTSLHPAPERISPEAELEAILPADVLEALDEPLELDDEDDSAAGTNDSDSEHGSRAGSKTGTGTPTGSARPQTGDSSSLPAPDSSEADQATPKPVLGAQSVPAPELDASGQPVPPTEPPATPQLPSKRAFQSDIPRPTRFESEAFENRPTSVFGAAGTHSGTPSEPPNGRSSSPPASSTLPPMTRGPSMGTSMGTSMGPSMGPSMGAERDPRNATRPSEAQVLEVPAVLDKGDAVRALARVVRARYTGALAFEDPSGIRRVVFRDGDFVTAASGAEGETLIEFLAQRGDVREEVVTRLVRKLPQFGRHAGAALIAQGHLRQDELWPVLRAHAEWLVARIVGLLRGAASLEHDVPLRLQAEPAVFGGATGAEVLVEIIRRAVPAEQASARLGGPETMIERGDQPALVSECALAEAEAELVGSIVLESLAEILRRAGSKDFASVVYALVELSVLGIVSGQPRPTEAPKTVPKPDRLDHEALRARISSRKALMEEGDYFALLGVARNATNYDIRRAYTTLKEELEPSRILTGEIADLRDDLTAIHEVLDEAYEILGDELRRERYRRALEAAPH